MRRSFIFQATALYPLLLKDKHRKWTNIEIITERWPVPQSGLWASVTCLLLLNMYFKVNAQYILHYSSSYIGDSWLLWDCCLWNPFWEHTDFECNFCQDRGWEGKIVSGQKITKSSMADLQRAKLPQCFSRKYPHSKSKTSLKSPRVKNSKCGSKIYLMITSDFS